mmetsp:Transcript_59692/g.144193  ORF Transcript_59692/g.144193 Transcript_59692/m.144193 type:complete len:480 (-) Transcript_59692:454-1893(-)
MARALVALAAMAMLGAAAAGHGDGAGFSWDSEDGAFTVTSLSLTTKSGNAFGPGEVCTLEFEGEATGPILAGTVKYKLYEDGVQHFIDSGNFPYFSCTNKGCDPTEPVALTLNNPNDHVTPYKVSVDYTMHKGSATSDFRLVVWGMDQNKFPYDFSITLGYNFTTAATGARALAATPYTDPFSSHHMDGTFNISSVILSTPSGQWSAGASASAIVSGTVNNKIIEAGTIKYKIYEYGQQHFIAQGFKDYFECDNKGCDPTNPISLTLKDPTDANTEFTAQLDFVMPAFVSDGVPPGIFTISFFGTDQDHTPYDFNAEIGYNFTAGSRALLGDGPAYNSDWENGAFHLTSAKIAPTDGATKWGAGGAAQVLIAGQVSNKNILAGTLRYKLYEYEVQYFVQQDSSPYFTCDNKGCDRSNPIALALADPTDPSSAFTANMNITLPKALKSGVYTLTLWGVDQDQAPYDFSANVHFNYTDSAF